MSWQAGVSNSTLFSTTPTTCSQLLTVSFYNYSARMRQKTGFIVKEACLLDRYLAVDVFVLHKYASCLPSRCLAMDIQVTLVR
jgi:hypothetical protein